MTGADIVPLLKKHPISVACVVISMACGAMLYLRGSKIAEYQQLSEQKSAEASATLANVRNSEKLAEQTVAMQAATAELNNRLMEVGKLGDNLQYFYRMESDTGVKLVDVRQGGLKPGAKKAVFVGIPYSVSVQGTFPQVLNFLGRLQKGAHFCRFIAVGLNKSAEDQVTLALNVEILGIP